ncbi:putative bifunctional diguanylate cyclase/phosphodiesterase [Arsenicicoccus dermatophilus]|uniref:putative bifunctional diguanylate cyclase/phosphodiesterase n=1 Tax=Arsenicicoccus dermatophilus TaxID=1076331 RepID=UPI001F4CEEDC|nr:EAL domain-containing protein [Arsenicicoccus dermatophilus]
MSLHDPQQSRVRDDSALLRVGLAASDAALRIRRAARAARRLERLTRNDPDLAHDATVQCAVDLTAELGYLGENDPGSALQVAAGALQVVDDLPPGPWSLVVEVQAQVSRGEALLAVGDVGRARECAQAAQSSLGLPLPDHPLVRRALAAHHALEGQCAATAGDAEAAMLAFGAGLDLDPDGGVRGLLLARLAQLMLTLGKPELGLPYVDRALQTDGQPRSDAADARLHGIRAELLLAAGRGEEALAESERAAGLGVRAGLNPSEHLRRVATVKATMGDPEAPDQLRRLAHDEARTAGDPTLATVLALATAHLRAGDPQAAVRALAPYAPARALPSAHREAVYDVLTEAVERAGDEHAALALLKEQREARRAEQRAESADRARTLAEQHQVDLLRADLERSRRREQELRLLVRQRTAELTWRAAHDELTGLYSREALLARLRIPVGPGTWRTVLYLDLDRFKVVNDAHGHDVGDALLSVVGRRLETAALALSGSTCVARLGGDEFCVLVDSEGQLDAVALARTLVLELGSPIDLPGVGAVRPEISIGVVQTGPGSLSSSGGTDLDLLRDADVALHRSKSEGGGGIYVFGQADREQALRRFEVEHRVRRGLEDGRILPAYDPIVDLSTGRVVGVEALCRLEEDGRRVRAAEFIEIAEESGLIDQLGRVVMAAAIRDLASSTRSHFVAINLGPRELRRPGLLADLTRRLDEAGISRERLVVEVTERSFVDVASTEAEVLRSLADAGVRLAIDDFSTGHSSMVHLSWMPVQLLKIDRSLVVRAARSDPDRTLVAAVIGMAQTLGLQVVAEGIEQACVGRVLRDLGCDYAQGHLFAESETIAQIPESFDLERLLAGPDDGGMPEGG